MSIFHSKKFLPLFITQFMGAFNDNLLKNALIMLVTYRIALENPQHTQTLVTLAAGLFILPFFLFSALAGQFADKYDRARLTRIIKITEIIIMICASIGFYVQNVEFLLFSLFCMGTHSTFFGPIKYALLPQHLQEKELLSGNAYIEAGTFLAILVGTIIGGLLILQEGGVAFITIALISVAVLGYLASRHIPAAPAPDPQLNVSYNLWRETCNIINASRNNRQVFRCILGISWFWLIGATFLSQFPVYAKDVLRGDATLVTLFLTLFSVGIGLGSIVSSKLLRGQINSTYVPIAALGITIFTLDLYFASAQVSPQSTALMNAWKFMVSGAGWRITLDLLLIAICAGIYIVPLYAIMQHRSETAHGARIIAANNVINALFMVVAAIGTLIMLQLSFTIPDIFLTLAILNSGVVIYICALLPNALLRSLTRAVLKLLYRVEVKGMEHYVAAGDRVLIVANHVSFLDPVLIAAFLPKKITFAINTHIARRWWMKPVLLVADVFPLDPTNPLATKTLIDTLKKNNKYMIFPEGRITNTGALMKIYEGSGMIADKSGATLLPIRIEGAEYSPFSRMKGKIRLRWFPKITFTVLPPCTLQMPEEIKGRKRRQMASMKLYDIMTGMVFESSDYNKPLFASLLHAKTIHGRNHIIAEDVERKPVSYGQFISRCFVLGRMILRRCSGNQAVGLMLPTSIPTALAFFGLHAYGRVPAMINFSSGAAQILIACQTAQISMVVTSRRFVTAAKLENVIESLTKAGVSVAYLEELREHITVTDRLFGLLALLMPDRLYTRTANRTTPDSPAFILFTSGSEGTPKGVMLSHANVQANRYQLASRIDFGAQDKLFNCMPMFHAFGLTGGTLLPILTGIRTFYYPSPLHYRIVPELIYDTNATILFGTDTFLSGYARFAHPYDLRSVRYVFAGAEKLKNETRNMYHDKFGVRIFEGYGATETAPVISANTPMQYRAGTVGRLMPGIEWRLESIPGIEEGGQLWVKGANIMLGYLRAEKPGELQPPVGGWYDTGDVVTMDAEGYITIQGRTKRFAKIGGEMVSLSAVEVAIDMLWLGYTHAGVSIPDAKKGEQIVLFTTYKNGTRDEIIQHFRLHHLPELSVPKQIIVLDAMPLLGTGKTDYSSLTL